MLLILNKELSYELVDKLCKTLPSKNKFSYETNLKTEPNNKSETLFLLHEGAKVQVIENYNNWIKIRLVNGQTGFIQLIDVKIL